MTVQADHHRSAAELKTSLIGTVPSYFPGHADGLVLVVAFREQIPHQQVVEVSSAWSPYTVDLTDYCLWGRPDHDTRPVTQPDIVIPEPVLHQLDQTVAQLEARGAFHYFDPTNWVGGNNWWDWMDPQPDANPGLARLVITIIERRPALSVSPARAR